MFVVRLVVPSRETVRERARSEVRAEASAGWHVEAPISSASREAGGGDRGASAEGGLVARRRVIAPGTGTVRA